MTSKCQVFSFTVPEKPKIWTELARRGTASAGPWRAKTGDPLETFKIFSKKSRNAEKKLKGGCLVSPGILCYAGKKEPLGTKKDYSILAVHYMKRQLKIGYQ